MCMGCCSVLSRVTLDLAEVHHLGDSEEKGGSDVIKFRWRLSHYSIDTIDAVGSLFHTCWICGGLRAAASSFAICLDKIPR